MSQDGRRSDRNRLSRRELIRTSAALGIAAGIGVTGPMTSGRSVRAQDDAGQSANPIRIGMTGDGRTLDPPDWANINERHFIPAIFDNLVEIDAHLNPAPGLARSWEASDDELEWTFHLQEGVLFHDGTELNAEAAVYNLQRVLDPASNLRHRANIEVISDVEPIDPLTFKITLRERFTPILATLNEAVGYISSPAAIEEFGDEYAFHPVGTGPFRFVDWQRDSQLELARFDQYWRDGLPRAAGVIFQPIPDTTVKLTNLRTGTIDLVDSIAPTDVEQVVADSSLQLYTLEGSSWPMIRLNTVKPPFDSMPLRQAVQHAINKAGIIAAVNFGRGQPAFGPISPIYAEVYDPAIEQTGLQYDLDLARAKLAEAGRADGFGFGLDLGSAPTTVRMAELIQASLQEVGIQVTINTMESAAFTDRLRSKEFEAALGSWTPRPDVDGTMYQHFHTDGLANWVSYSNPEVDRLLEETRRTPIGEERNELFREAERIIAQEVPWAFLVFDEVNRASRAAVTGYTMTPDTLLHLGETAVE